MSMSYFSVRKLLFLFTVIGLSGCTWRAFLIQTDSSVVAKDTITGDASTDNGHGPPLDLVSDGASLVMSRSRAAMLMLFRPSDGAMPMASERPQGNDICPPKFMILGIRKGGTTSLNRYISSSSPDIFPFRIRREKRGDFASKVGGGREGEARGKIGTEVYASQFQKIPKHMIFGEGTVSRLIDEPPELAKFCNESRFFVLLRDPVSRCHSQFLMRARRRSIPGFNMRSNLTAVVAREVQAFENYVDKHENLAHENFPGSFLSSASNCLYEGAYVLHLRRLIGSGVDPSKVRIYFSNDLNINTDLVVVDALHFLGLSSKHVDREELKQHFNMETHRDDRPPNLELAESLKQRMKDDMAPFDRELMKFLGVDSLPWRPEWN